jgi:hypothetical protein
MKMKKLMLITAALVALVAPAHAATTINNLYVCEGELVKESGGYEIIERG